MLWPKWMERACPSTSYGRILTNKFWKVGRSYTNLFSFSALHTSHDFDPACRWVFDLSYIGLKEFCSFSTQYTQFPWHWQFQIKQIDFWFCEISFWKQAVFILGYRRTIDEISTLFKISLDTREVAIWKIGESKPQYVPILHPAHESLQYPLLFSAAPETWSIRLKDKKEICYPRYSIVAAKYCLMCDLQNYANFPKNIISEN